MDLPEATKSSVNEKSLTYTDTCTDWVWHPPAWRNPAMAWSMTFSPAVWHMLSACSGCSSFSSPSFPPQDLCTDCPSAQNALSSVLTWLPWLHASLTFSPSYLSFSPSNLSGIVSFRALSLFQFVRVFWTTEWSASSMKAGTLSVLLTCLEQCLTCSRQANI